FGTARDSQTVTALNPTADEDRFSFTPFTRHPFFFYVDRWILERVICPGRQVIVDLGCGPGAITELILERVRDQQPPPHVNGAYVEGTSGFWRRWIVRSVQALRENGIEVKHSGHAAAMEWFSADQYRAACTAAGLRPTTVELLRVDMTRQALIDIGRFSLF